MLKKMYRLGRHELALVKSSGTNYASQYFSVRVSPTNLAFSRLAVVTSAKLAKKAVRRNKLRRAVYASLSPLKWPGHDIVIYPKISMLELSSEEISTNVAAQLSKILELS